jgi:hypothetical protein
MVPAELSWPHALFVQHLLFKAMTTFISLHGTSIDLTESSNILLNHPSQSLVTPTRAMARVKNIAATLILAVIMVAIASLPITSAAIAIDNSNVADDAALAELTTVIKKALDGVIAAAPPSKMSEVKSAVVEHELTAVAVVNKAKGNKEKLAKYIKAYKIAAKLVTAAKPESKFRMMEDTFTLAARPIP